MARPKKYVVRLSDEQVKELKAMLKKAKLNETLTGRIRVLLIMDENHAKKVPSNKEAALLCNVSETTVVNTIKLFHERGLESVLTLNRNPNSDLNGLKLNEEAQAKLMALVQSPPPDGKSKWSVRMLSKVSKEALGQEISPATISRFLKRNR